MIDKTNEQASVLLGKSLENYPNSYDPNILVKIERSLNRVQYDIDENSLDFIGYDIWNCYECSFITNLGEPVHFVAKMVVNAKSRYIVESKSMKLYLFSFNMSTYGNSREEGIDKVCDIISKDLSNLLESCVTFCKIEEFSLQNQYKDYVELNLSNTIFNEFKENPKLLSGSKDRVFRNYRVIMSNFRSNCRVTNQPDFSNILIDLVEADIDLQSLGKYLVSFRNESHFHEEIVEAIFTRLDRIIEPKKLCVIGHYTRRGGIDIVPIRTNDLNLIDKNYYSLNSAIVKYPNQ